MSRPILIAGFGRCGTTMLMTMLSAAGIPTIGAAPGFEDNRSINPDPVARAAFYRGLSNVATKLLEPMYAPPPIDLSALVIWLDRDPHEQAKSALKFMNFLTEGQVQVNRRAIRMMEGAYRKDRAKSQECALMKRCQSMVLAFEDVIADPEAISNILSQFLGNDYPAAQWNRMPAIVHKRRPACLPNIAELQMVV